MGKRQVGELKPHELVITFLISSTATIPLQDNNMPLLNCIIPVLLFVSLEIIVAILSIKSVKFRNLIQGKPIVIIDKGKIDEKKLRQLRFTVDDLCDALRQQGYWDIAEVQNAVIETNGSINLEPFCDLGTSVSFTMDYKLSCSNMEQKMCLNNFSILEPKDTVKFVVGSLADCQKAFEIIQSYQLEGRCHIYLSPVFGMIEPSQIVEFMKQNKMNGINLQIQMHKVIWDPEERGV